MSELGLQDPAMSSPPGEAENSEGSPPVGAPGGMPPPGNALGVGAGGPGSEGPEPPDLGGLLPHMEGAHQAHASKYGKIQKALGLATTMREQMDTLVKLGDTVTQEDVVKAATKLVSRGVGVEEIAGILSEMPDGGEPLKGWVMQNDMKLRQNELTLKTFAQSVRHQAGVAALRLLAGHSMAKAHGFGAEPVPAMAPPTANTGPATGAANDLMGGTGNG